MPTAIRGAFVLGALFVHLVSPTPALAAPPPTSVISWRALQPGLEYAHMAVPELDRHLSSDMQLHVVRIDPRKAPLHVVMAGALGRGPLTAAQWSRDARLAVAINMGMFRDDWRTNVGFSRAAGYVNNPRWAKKYKSVLAFGPHVATSPPAILLDLDATRGLPGPQAVNGYDVVIQNLRLIRAPGIVVWGEQARRWSEAAVAMDHEGRVLFVFSRYPHTMRAFGQLLLSLPLGVTSAFHVEGGPEASLSIHVPGFDLDLGGSYETGFNENDQESSQWPLPNVLGVRRP